MSQTDLAMGAGVSQSLVSKILTNTAGTLRHDTVVRITDYLDRVNGDFAARITDSKPVYELHAELAEECRQVASMLATRSPRWAVMAYAQASLHLIDAFLARNNGICPVSKHERERSIRIYLRHIWPQYWRLTAATADCKHVAYHTNHDFNAKHVGSARADFESIQYYISGAGHCMLGASCSGAADSGLSPRLRTILDLILDGWTRKGMAEHLGLSLNTVAEYTKAVCRHFDVSGSQELVNEYRRRTCSSRGDFVNDEAASGLSPRLRTVFGLLLEGWTRKGMAEHLGLSVNTIAEYTKVVYRHFGVNGQRGLIHKFRQGSGGDIPKSQNE